MTPRLRARRLTVALFLASLSVVALTGTIPPAPVYAQTVPDVEDVYASGPIERFEPPPSPAF